MTPEQAIALGQQAQQLLDHPLMQKALGALRDGIRDAFFALPDHAAEERERLHMMDKCRQQFESVFVLLINDATVSQAELLDAAHTQARREAIERRTQHG